MIFHCGLPWWLSSKESACNAGNAGDMGLIPGLGRSIEEAMATHSSILAWEIPWTEELSRLQSMGSQRVRHDWAHTHTILHCLYRPYFVYPFIHRGTLGCFFAHVSFLEIVSSPQCNVWLQHITIYKALSLLGYMWRLWLSLSLNCGKAGVPAVLLEPPTY